MIKKACWRGLLGFPLGVFIGYAITLVFSLIVGDGSYYSCEYSLVLMMGSEIRAMILQSTLCGILGVSFAASSVFWQCETWSIAKQTGVYFLVNAVVMLPIAYFLRWMSHSLSGFLSYLGVFIFIFVAIWLGQYFILRGLIRLFNRKIKER